MPRYKYRREDGTEFIVKQSIKDDPLEECPETGQEVERIIDNSPMFKWKGSGFHATDYDETGPKDEEMMKHKRDDDIDTRTLDSA